MSRRRKILILVGAVFGVAILVPVIHHYQLKAAVNRYKAELRAKGEPMELAQVVPPTVPPEQNSAELFTNATSLLNKNDSVLSSNQPPMMRMIGPGKAMIGWKQPDVRENAKNGATNSWADIEAALEKEQVTLNLVRALPQQPIFDFKLNYSDGFGKMKFSSLAPAKKTAQRLAASAANNLRHGDTDAATKDIQAILAVDHGISHDRTLISELVRIAIAQIAVSANWEFLQSTAVKDEQLATLQQSWTDLEFIQTFENAMNMERVVGDTDLTTMRASGLASYYEPLNKLGLWKTEDDFFSRLKLKYKSMMWRYWWSYPDELRGIKGVQSVMEAARQTQTNHSFFAADTGLKTQIESLGIKSDAGDGFWFTDPAKADFHFIISSSMTAFERAFNKVMKVETARQMNITAIALKRFQLKHGNYPAQLSELAPEFLASVPLDPVDGQPLRYRLNADGNFLLYSIGENGKDDGGDPSLADQGKYKSLQWQNSDALDWVWPQPATGEEIQHYYSNQSIKSKN